MTQQDPSRRPATIEEIKKELIGRKNSFVALQTYNEATKVVVQAGKAPEFAPIAIAGMDYNSGTLILKLDRHIPPGWVQEFHQPRSGFNYTMNAHPRNFNILGDRLSIDVHGSDEHIQQIVNYAKGYVVMANQGYAQQLHESAMRREREEREELQRRTAEAQRRLNILKNIKL